MNTIKIKNSDGSQLVLNFRKKINGLFYVTGSFFDDDGYYNASRSYDFDDVSIDDLERNIIKAKTSGSKVEIY